MQPLSAYEIVQAWEWGLDKHPVDRGLLLLSFCHPDTPVDELARLTIGQRNGRLLRLRQLTFGPQLDGFACCGRCREALEFSVPVDGLLLDEPATAQLEVEVGEMRISLRSPNSGDLAAIVGLPADAAARRLLFEKCVMTAEKNGAAIPPQNLPDTLIPALSDALSDHDPQAEMRFALTCAACSHQWSALFDIVSFLWTELEARARYLFAEVNLLARTYGWGEAEILQMSQRRRQAYLELAG